MEMIKPTDLDGKKGTDLAHAQEIWIATYKNDVRMAINNQRNYVHQELHTFMEKTLKDGKGDTMPNVEEIQKIVLRDDMDDAADKDQKDRLCELFIEYWRTLMPKVAGHWSWSPNKQEYYLLSYGKQDPTDSDSDDLVSASDEAFLVVLWENSYKKWACLEAHRQNGTQPDPEDSRLVTPYSSSKSGQKKFGGWKKEGIQKYNKYVQKIRKNHKTNKTFVTALESDTLQQIRMLEKTQEREDSKKSKKKAKARVKGDFDDIEDDENDMDDW